MKFNKLMSILMATAVVSSITPATTVKAAIKLEALEGTIVDAKAFMGGKYVFEGYKTEDQDNGIYYFDGQADVIIEDAESMGVKYGMNYINFKEDEILFNLATGQAEEDDEETKLALMENKFRSSVVKKASRYEDTPNLIRQDKIVHDTFSGIWYEYLVAENEDGTGKSYTVYLSDTGKYVDASETLNMVYYNKSGEKIKLDTYDDLDENGLESIFEKALILDQENIYKLVLIAPKADENGIEELNLENNTDLITKLGWLKYAIEYGIITPYIQKISMEQGDKEDGAYIPKQVITCEAYDFDVIDFLVNNIAGKNTARISGNNLYTIELNDDEDEITMKKYVMKKIKDKNSVEGKTLDKRVLELDEDFDYVVDEDIQDYDVDVLGNLWILNKGKVKKFENGKLETKYTVDRSMDNISVYLDNSLIVWNTENEIYSTVSPTPAVEDKVEEEVENPGEDAGSKDEVELISGWIKNTDGTWNFKKEDGNLATGWLKENNIWYYLNTQGVMQTGWIKDGSTWYYLNGSGAMQTGWVKDGAEWYYLNASGAMQTGWIKDTNGKWYYLYNSGAMAYSTVIDGYKLDASGAWIN